MIRTQSGSTFDGFIREFDAVRIDNFANGTIKTQLYLLSHSHTDHLKGLDAKFFTSGCSIICSQLTLDILKKTSNIPKENFKLFKLVQENLPFETLVNGETLRITLIPSYHCPGSVMFLIESSSKSVLYTGDIRAEHWWVQSLGQNPFLLPYLNESKTLDNIYLDTTFGYRGEPFIEIMSNNQGITFLADVMNYYPISSPDLKFFLMETTTGFEELWYKIISIFDQKAYMEPHLEKRLKILVAADVPYCKYLQSKSSSEKDSKFIIGKQIANDCCEFPIAIRSAINCSLLDLKTSYFPISMEDVDPADVTHIKTTISGYKILEYQGDLWLLYNGHLLPQNLKVPFSRHSSYSECINFISNLSTRQVYGCVDSRISWELGFQMSRVFGEHCKGSLFIFDKERETIYGKVNKTGQVCVVDKWGEDYNLIKLREAVPLPSFDFKGQHHVSGFARTLSGDDLKFVQQSKRLLNLNKYYMGRNIQKCNKLISQNRFQIKKKRLADFRQREGILGNVDEYESHTDISEDSLELRRELCINENDYRRRLVLSDYDEDTYMSSKGLKETKESCLVGYTELRFSKVTNCGPNKFPILEFTQDIQSRAGKCATDDHGYGWFDIHLSCLDESL